MPGVCSKGMLEFSWINGKVFRKISESCGRGNLDHTN